MPDTIITPIIPDEPLWSRRLRAASQRNDRFFREARARDGRAIPYEAVQSEREQINTTKDGRVRRPTTRVQNENENRTGYWQTRSVGATAAQRQAITHQNTRTFDRMKSEQAIENGRKMK